MKGGYGVMTSPQKLDSFQAEEFASFGPVILTERANSTGVKADPSDNACLATALAGGARWVVSGNTRHLTPLDGYAGLRIVGPAVFLAELDAQT
jgi:predicted nucleic acid-binding protein